MPPCRATHRVEDNKQFSADNIRCCCRRYILWWPQVHFHDTGTLSKMLRYPIEHKLVVGITRYGVGSHVIIHSSGGILAFKHVLIKE